MAKPTVLYIIPPTRQDYTTIAAVRLAVCYHSDIWVMHPWPQAGKNINEATAGATLVVVGERESGI